VHILGGLVAKFKTPAPAGHINGKLLYLVVQPRKGAVSKNYF